MSVLDVWLGRTTHVTGLKDEADGALRVYVGPRYRGVYVLLGPEHADEQQSVRRAWDAGGHVFIPMPPPDCLMQDSPVTPLERSDPQDRGSA